MSDLQDGTARGAAAALRGRRILFVFCSLELGGAERQGLHLARHLKALGGDVRVWSTTAARGLVAQSCEEAGIPWAVHDFRWPCRKSSLALDAWRLLRALRRARPDVILPYTTSPNVGCGLVWRLTPARACIWGQRSGGGLRGDRVERLAFRLVSGVICNAPHLVEYLGRTLGRVRAPLHVIPNGVSLAPVGRMRAAWRAECGIPEAAVVAVMVANFREQKHHGLLLQAWRRVVATTPAGSPRPHLLLAGADLQTQAAVRFLSAELGLAAQVSFLGQVRDVSGLLCACDIGVLTSQYEGLPNAVLEYMASGLPVVATDLPGTREALGDEPLQPCCRPGDVEHLTALLRALLDDPQRRRRLGDRNRARAMELFSVDAMCARTVDVIVGFLKSSPPPPGAAA